MADDPLPSLRTTAESRGFSDERHFLGSPCKRGHIFQDGKTWRTKNGGACVLCKREIAMEWKAAHPERARASTARRDRARPERRIRARERWPFAASVGGVRRRAATKGIPCNITADDAKILWREQRGLCFWTGRPLDFTAGGPRAPLRPSLDRLRPELGYVLGNVVWANNFSNRARGEASAEDFARLMDEFGFKGAYLALLK